MKTIFATLIAIFLFSCSESIKSTDIPEDVLSSFNSNFPDVKNVEWELENKTYEAEFMQNDKEMSASLNESGEWVIKEIDHKGDEEDVETIILTQPLR